ncbi:MAG: polysaccharide biosynthesis C-terminal domain-containing protein [Roseiflexaceae bacterium]
MVGFIGPAVALVLTPLYIRALGVADYGTTDLVQTFAHVAYTLAILGMPTVLASVYRLDASYAPMPPTTVATALVTVAGWAVVIAGILMWCVPWLAQVIQRPDTIPLMYIQLVAMPCGVIHGTLLAVVRLREAARLAAIYAVVAVIVTALTRVMLVLWLSWGVAGMVVAAAATHIINALVVLIWTRSLWWGRVDTTLMMMLWRRGLPLIPANLAMWLLLYQDRWFLAGRVDAVILGQYALAATLVTLLALLIDPFKNAWQPVALAAPATAAIVPTTLRVYVAVAGAIAVLTGVWGRELLWLLGGTPAQAAAPLIWPLLLVPLCSGALTIVGLVPTAQGKNTGLAWSTVAAAVLNTILNVLLIPPYAAMGAAVATGIAALVMPGVLWWQSQRLQPQSYAYGRLLIYGGLACLVALCAQVMPALLPRMLVCSLYLLVLVAAEWDAVRRLWYGHEPSA